MRISDFGNRHLGCAATTRKPAQSLFPSSTPSLRSISHRTPWQATFAASSRNSPSPDNSFQDLVLRGQGRSCPATKRPSSPSIAQRKRALFAVQLFHTGPEFGQGRTALVLEFLQQIRHGEFERKAVSSSDPRSRSITKPAPLRCSYPAEDRFLPGRFSHPAAQLLNRTSREFGRLGLRDRSLRESTETQALKTLGLLTLHGMRLRRAAPATTREPVE